jgi:hypothetical protein
VAKVAAAAEVRELDIFTLNHDLLVEQELADAAIKLADGFGKPGLHYREFDGAWMADGRKFRILKLHGSLNWFLTRQKLDGKK